MTEEDFADTLASRAVQAAWWGMPIVAVEAMRTAFFRAGAEYGDILYFSSVADWRFQFTTPNNSTLYVYFNWNTADGPVVIDIPAKTEHAGVFGSICDAWSVPLADFGTVGEDAGAGGRYLLLPPGYDGPIEEGVIPVQSATVNGYALARLIPATSAPEDTAAALAAAGQIQVNTLGVDRASTLIDIAGVDVNGIPSFDIEFFRALARMVDEEPIAPHDLLAHGILSSIGIVKGEAFNPDDATIAHLNEGVARAHREFMEAVATVIPWWDDRTWGLHHTIGPETGFTFRTDRTYDVYGRGLVFFLGFAIPKQLGSATFYLTAAHSGDGAPLDGSHSYRLHVPADVPAQQYWALTVYDLETSGFLSDAPKCSVDSFADLKTNADGSVDLTLSSTPPADDAAAANWVYVTPGKAFFVIFRFYGPEPAMRDGSWKLDDLQRD